MNNIKSRKYSRSTRKGNPTSDESELSLSSTAALSILVGTFLVGLISGKLISMCRKS